MLHAPQRESVPQVEPFRREDDSGPTCFQPGVVPARARFIRAPLGRAVAEPGEVAEPQ